MGSARSRRATTLRPSACARSAAGSPAELCARFAESSLERAYLRCVHGDERA
jgi:hypothetical protein